MPRALSAWPLVALVVALGLPLVVHNPYYLQVIVTAFILAIAVYGLNILLGFTGLLSLGHAAFYGIGAYTVALLETRAGMSFWPAMLAGCAASVALGYLVGIISLRTRGHYFAIFTAAIGVMISIVLTNWQELTNGSIGIINIPPPAPIGPISFESQEAKYYLVLAGLLLAIYITARVRGSLLGRSMFAVASNEDLARAAGIDVTRVKLIAFMLATFLAGLGGGLFAIFIGFLGPDSSGLDVTFDMLLYLIVGGMSTVAGPLIGTLVLVILTQLLQGFEHYRMLIFGPALVLLVMFFPGGIAGGLARLRARFTRRTEPAPATKEAGATS
ncbi:MAG: branched-chain amino acid ABC transporter permease [Candidatus Velthaea sp.]